MACLFHTIKKRTQTIPKRNKAKITGLKSAKRRKLTMKNSKKLVKLNNWQKASCNHPEARQGSSRGGRKQQSTQMKAQMGQATSRIPNKATNQNKRKDHQWLPTSHDRPDGEQKATTSLLEPQKKCYNRKTHP
ncbi:hypothetical protein M5K25_005663 [Dendrobium thyrsiflorum]|uniref:Uncharacterized protein n=1 Tax=Dendrobium thyrsiflorum TaxID=117978 RepID=A0ABD0VIG5_DENTH